MSLSVHIDSLDSAVIVEDFQVVLIHTTTTTPWFVSEYFPQCFTIIFGFLYAEDIVLKNIVHYSFI